MRVSEQVTGHLLGPSTLLGLLVTPTPCDSRFFSPCRQDVNVASGTPRNSGIEFISFEVGLLLELAIAITLVRPLQS